MLRLLTPHYRILITKAVLYKNMQNSINHVFSQTMDIEHFIKGSLCLQLGIKFPHLNILFNSTKQRIVKKGTS